ncbi:ras GEF [Basidiobolus meristosporus CBS 931.73]|uniref:Ras GEF n=1 Tax=Basidiobolus meristosporus CBS 931.73 TaxID=1314790 RepID=A0A1Y1YUA3_9FUNG|nr:ras GEF [Basidiobolus meristosporus CBS 931.73]|eukprot:ORY01559.1 ras GEF [Basidiobolus meristosporus CBS 931.73]
MEDDYLGPSTVLVRTLVDYVPTYNACLPFKQGQLIHVHNKDDSGWWDGTCNGLRGWFPSSYVVTVEEVDSKSNPFHLSHFNQSPDTDVSSIASYIGESDFAIPKPAVHESDTDYDSIGNASDEALEACSTPEKEHPFPTAQQLPEYWHTKTTSQGQRYYYNVITNATAWDVTDTGNKIFPAPNLDRVVLDVSKDFMPSNTLTPVPTWDSLVQSIYQSFSALNESIKKYDRVSYGHSTETIIETVRNLLLSTGSICWESEAAIDNKSLRPYQNSIIASLSQLVLTSKIASGIWPPPDIENKLCQQARQVLLAVRSFVNIGRDLNLDLRSNGFHGNTSDMNGEFQGNVELNDLEFIEQLDQSYLKITQKVESLKSHISSEAIEPDTLESLVKDVVHVVGQALSLVEDLVELNFDHGNPDLYKRMSDQIHYLRVIKESLKNGVNDLITNASNALDQFAPEDCIKCLYDSLLSLQEIAEEILKSTKLTIDLKERIEQTLLQEDIESFHDDNIEDSDYWVLKRKVKSLNLVARSRSDSTSSSPGTPHVFVIDPSEIESMPKLPGLQNLFSGETYSSPLESPIDDSEHHIPEPLKLSKKASSDPGTSPMRKDKSKPKELKDLAQGAEASSMIDAKRMSNAKILKFFGVESTANTKEAPQKRPDDWFLAYDYKPGEITRNATGQINGGTWEALVEQLTLHDTAIDTEFTNTFLLAFRSFSNPMKLSHQLISRFNLQPPEGLSEEELVVFNEKKLKPIRIRIFNILKYWLESYFFYDQDYACLDTLFHFANNTLTQGLPVAAKKRLITLLEQKKSREPIKISTIPQTKPLVKVKVKVSDSSLVGAFPEPATNSPMLSWNVIPWIKTRGALVIADLDAQDIARQLTLIDFQQYSLIQPEELLNLEFSKKEGSKSINVKALTKLSNKITGWVAENIIRERDLKKRCHLLKHFIKIGEQCYKLHNYNTLMAIMSALNSTTITRLRKTWEPLSNKTKATLEALRQATDHSRNYCAYRAKLKTSDMPCLPFFGVYLTDLTFIHEGNPAYRRNGGASMIINFDKHYKSVKVIQEIQRFQQTHFQFPELPELREFLRESLDRIDWGSDSSKLYEASLEIEPKEGRDVRKLDGLMSYIRR